MSPGPTRPLPRRLTRHARSPSPTPRQPRDCPPAIEIVAETPIPAHCAESRTRSGTTTRPGTVPVGHREPSTDPHICEELRPGCGSPHPRLRRFGGGSAAATPAPHRAGSRGDRSTRPLPRRAPRRVPHLAVGGSEPAIAADTLTRIAPPHRNSRPPSPSSRAGHPIPEARNAVSWSPLCAMQPCTSATNKRSSLLQQRMIPDLCTGRRLSPRILGSTAEPAPPGGAWQQCLHRNPVIPVDTGAGPGGATSS